MSLSGIRLQRRSSKPENKMGKRMVYLNYACYICGNILSSAVPTINHVKRIHGYDIPTRLVGHKRPLNQEVEYVKMKDEPYDDEELACPSCWFHWPEDDFEAFNCHTREEHDPIKVDITKDGNDVYTASESSPGRETRLTTTSRE